MRWGSVQDKDGRGITAVSDSQLMQMSVTQWVPPPALSPSACSLPAHAPSKISIQCTPACNMLHLHQQILGTHHAHRS